MKDLESRVSNNLERIRIGAVFSDSEFMAWLKDIYALLDYPGEEPYGLSLASICFIADKNPSDSMTRAILSEVIAKSRIFLYRDMLGKQDLSFLKNNPLSSINECAKIFYTDPVTSTVLTKPQKEVLELFNKKRRLVLSAPTSFGKTKILEEIILNNNYDCVAIIVPTNALLSENYHRLRENETISSKYALFYSSRINLLENPDKKKIFILTPEKLLNLLDEHILRFDFFVFDEFYKVSKDFESDEGGDYDKRYKVFQHALYALLLNRSVDFYMIGPYVDQFSKSFLRKENATFKEYKVEIVQKKIFSKNEDIGSLLEIDLIKDKKRNVCMMLDSLHHMGQQNLIYTPRQEVAENITKSYVDHLKGFKGRKSSPLIDDFIKYIRDNISSEWSLIPALQSGIAFHHGGIPRYIQTEIVSLFNNKIINSLVCTTTLAEGVNTTAKNVLVYDAKKATTVLTTFDRKNIEGRSGRFAEHFIGNVFYLEAFKDNEQVTSVDFELYDADNLTKEDVILVRDDDLSGNNLIKKEEMVRSFEEKRISSDVIKKNRFINVDKQVELIEMLRREESLPFENIKNNNDFISDYETLKKLFLYIFKLASLEKGGRWRGYTVNQISWIAFDYLRKPFFKTIITHKIILDYSDNMNTRIRKSLKTLSEHFEFLIPRYLQAFQGIYNFVAKEVGGKQIELGYIVNLMEYGTSDQTEVLLRDAGIPLEIVRKIKKVFVGCENNIDLTLRKKERASVFKEILDEFEFKVLNRYL